MEVREKDQNITEQENFDLDMMLQSLTSEDSEFSVVRSLVDKSC